MRTAFFVLKSSVIFEVKQPSTFSWTSPRIYDKIPPDEFPHLVQAYQPTLVRSFGGRFCDPPFSKKENGGFFMSKFSTRDLTLAAVLAAVYAALTMLLPIPQYGPVQFRLAEALTVLPFVCPAAAPGLFIGCLLANLLSPYGLLDMVVGSGATLLACLLTMRMPSRYLAPLPPVLCNAILVGATIAYAEVGFGAGFWTAYALNALSVGIGELVVCYGLGIPLLSALDRVALPVKK